jgi:hypothetical protein
MTVKQQPLIIHLLKQVDKTNYLNCWFARLQVWRSLVIDRNRNINRNRNRTKARIENFDPEPKTDMK